MNVSRRIEDALTPKAMLAIGLGIVFVVVFTTGPIPDTQPDNYAQYDAVRLEVSGDEVVAVHVLTEQERSSLAPSLTPEGLETSARDESWLSEPERRAIEDGRARTSEDVTVGHVYEVDGAYYKLIRTGTWSERDIGEMCSESTIGDNTFCDDAPPTLWRSILFTVGGYLIGGAFVFHGWRQL